MRNKYLGKTYEGRWKVIGKKQGYVLENIYNGQTISVSYRKMKSIEEGRTNVSTIISRKLKKERIGVYKF